MELRSKALDNRIPRKYARDGGNVSPPLEWSGVPDAARELALVMENVSRSPETVQWLLYRLSPQVHGLPEDFMHRQAPGSSIDVEYGTTDEGNVGYDGPLGALGQTFHYRLRLFALDSPVDLPPGADRSALMKAISSRLIEEAQLSARYQSPYRSPGPPASSSKNSTLPEGTG